MRSIELFAGCGGLALGLHRAGWDSLFAVERDPMAFETLRANLIDEGAPYKAFPSWPSWLAKSNLDLIELLESPQLRQKLTYLRGAIDLVAGGPPCQGFSVGGRRDGADTRNSLVFRMLDFIELVRPKAVIIENVEGMRRKFVAKPGAMASSPADSAQRRLEALGYFCSAVVLDASNFGVPQARRRLVIVGIQKSLNCSVSLQNALARSSKKVRAKYNLPLERPVTVSEALDDLANARTAKCPDSNGFESGTYRRAHSAYARAMRGGISEKVIPDSHRLTKHGAQIKKLYELAHRTQPKGRLSKKFLMAQGTKKDKKVLLDPTKVASTVTTHPDEFIHYLYARNITVREMARLQSFPDNFRFLGRYTINGPRRKFDVARCSQVGNAVPPLMAEGLGLALREILQSAKPKSPRRTRTRRDEQISLPLAL